MLFIGFVLQTLILYLLNISRYPCTAIQCKNENNDSIDWFIAYKAPKIKGSNQELIKQGVGYFYLTPSNYSQWVYSQRSINDSHSLFGNTLHPFYNSESIVSVVYNDQPPIGSQNPGKGHTKGVILADSISGLWLVHSVPHFPQVLPSYGFPSSGVVEGQSFLCISLDLNNLNKVGLQLQYNEPQIYKHQIPEVFTTKLNELIKAVSGTKIGQAPWYHESVLESKSGMQFTTFAKTKDFKKELYEDLVAPFLQTDLMVESWLNGPGRLPSNCSKHFKVYNIESVSLKLPDVAFHDSKDHSKWAVSENSSWVCIGDINRQEHQKFRGGGTVCLNNSVIATNYKNIITSIEQCNN